MAFFPIFLGILPGFAWLIFYLKEEDDHPEPAGLIALTFVNGALFAFLALGAQLGLKFLYDSWGISYLSPLWIYSFSAIEEALKFAAAYVVVARHPALNEPIDAMVYAIVASLGFATMENIGVLWGIPLQSVYLPEVLHLVTFRFLGATLLHTLASGLLGYYWAKGIKKFSARRALTTGLFLATLLHGTFNILVLNFGEKGFSLILLFIAAFFVLADFEELRSRVT